jgi:hypothetical protein
MMVRAIIPWFSALLVISSVSLSNAQGTKHPPEGFNPDELAIHDYVLSMEKVNQYSDVSRKLETAAAKDPVMAAEMKKVENTNVYNVEKAALIEKSPRTAAFLKASGITAREFVLIPMTGVTAGIASAAQDAKRKPPAFVNPVNIQFVRDHRAELKKLEHSRSGDSDDRDSKEDSNEKDSDVKDKN